MIPCCWHNLLTKFVCLTFWLGAGFCAAPSAILAGIEPDFLIDSDPELEVPDPVRNFDPALKTLWLSALDRPEIDMQRMAAETIARAHLYGVPDLIEAGPRLEKILQADSSNPAARFAAARTLIVLESRGSSEQLWNASQRFGADLRQLVEPAMAEWNFSPATPVWVKRLDDPEIRIRDLLLAMRGLAQVGEQSALPRLLSIANDALQDPVIRLEAATATGLLVETGLEADAERLARNTRSPGFVNQLSAIRFLARHTTDNARGNLIDLAGHAEPVVAAAALNRLNEIDSALVVPLAESAIRNSDQCVRLEGATAYLRLPTTDRIPPLAQLLADADPGVRRDVCEGLVGLSEQPELMEPIYEAAVQILNGDRWQGQEQAALLLGALQYKSAANRLTELLESPRVEVSVASTWALRKVAVAATIPALIDKASRLTEGRKTGTLRVDDDQVVHLLEALGVLKAADAIPLLTQYIPKNQIMGERPRSAAIWALGLIKEGQRDAELEDALCARINDFSDSKPEDDMIKQMCAITLVRMNAVDRAPDIRGIVESDRFASRLSVALRWAVKELTGEVLPPPERSLVNQGNWFLQPFP